MSRRTETHHGAESRWARTWRARTLAGIAVVPLLVAGCATDDEAATNGGDASPTASPSPATESSQGQGGSASPGADSDDGGQASEEQLQATVDEIVGEVAEVRGLEPQSEIGVELVSQQEIGDITRQIRQREMQNRIVAPDVLAALRFVPQGTDLAELTERMASTAVKGLYDAESDHLYVVADQGPLGPVEQAATAHEIVHALQDQHFGLDRQFLAEGNPEAAGAFSHLVEGDAAVAQQQWMSAHLSATQRQEVLQQSTSQQGLQDLPQAMRVSMVLPYVMGPQLVQTIESQEGGAGVNAAFDDPPDTTVEVIDPQLYLNGFEPQDVSGLASPGQGWNESNSLTFGAHDAAVMQPPAQALQGQLPVASQWRGGRMRVWRSDDQLAVGVATTFAGDGASAFCERVESWYREQAQAQPAGDDAFTSDRDAMAIECGQGDVHFAIAPTVEEARAVIGG